jgi:hypothetical protein
MFLVMSDDDRRIITEHGRNNIYQTFFPNGGVELLDGVEAKLEVSRDSCESRGFDPGLA